MEPGVHRGAQTSVELEPLAVVLPAGVVDVIVERVTQQVAARWSYDVEPWVGVGEVAAHLCCKLQRIYDLVCRWQAGGIPHRKEGSRLLFRLSEIDRWIDSGGAA